MEKRSYLSVKTGQTPPKQTRNGETSLEKNEEIPRSFKTLEVEESKTLDTKNAKGYKGEKQRHFCNGVQISKMMEDRHEWGM